MNKTEFDRAVLQVGARLRAYFRRRVWEPATADDLAQETLLKVYRSREALRDHSRLEAWLFRIAHFTMVDYIRRKAPHEELPRELPGECGDDNTCVKDVMVCSARCYLETLPKSYRDPVHLADYEGLPHHDVARQLGLSLAAVKSRVRRGKRMVRALMEAHCHLEYDVHGKIIGYRVRDTKPSCKG